MSDKEKAGAAGSSSDSNRSSSPEKRGYSSRRYSNDRRANRNRDKSGSDKETLSLHDVQKETDNLEVKIGGRKVESGTFKNSNQESIELTRSGSPGAKPSLKKLESASNSVTNSEKNSGKYGETKWGPRQSSKRDDRDNGPTRSKSEGNSSSLKDDGKDFEEGESRKPDLGARGDDNDRGKEKDKVDKEKERSSKGDGNVKVKQDESSAETDKRSDKSRTKDSEDHSRKMPRQESYRKSSSREERSAGKEGKKLESRKVRTEPKLSAKETEAKRIEEEKRKKEELEKKKESERLRLEEEKRKEQERQKLEEEERKRKEVEEAQRLIEEEKKLVYQFAEDCKEHVTTKQTLRAANVDAADNRPDESFFSKLDSSLKKNTAFVKKLKNLTEAQKDSLTKDFNALNLSKYIGEAAASLVEAKLKMSDIPCAVHMCSLLHQRYAEFSPMLLENWIKVLPSKKDEKIANLSKLRVDLRFLAELVSVGVFRDKEGLNVLANLLSLLTVNDKDEHNNLAIILSFCKHCGDDYAGILSRKHRQLAEKYNVEIVRSQMLPPERKKACRNLLSDYCSSLYKHLIKSHKELKSLEKQNRRILHTKGELSTEKSEHYESVLAAYQKLLSNAETFSDILDEDMPELPEDETKDTDGLGFDIFNPLKDMEYQYEGDSTLFEDDDTRMFYETLPDLKVLVPAILYKDSAQIPSAETNAHTEDSAMEEDLLVEDIEKEFAEAETYSSDKRDSKIENQKDADISVEDVELMPPEVEEEEGESNTKVLLENFLTTLPNCVNRELIDKAAVEFCMKLNTKINRKKLVRALFTVQRTRYDLLPFYSRLVAELNPCMPDVAADLCTYLKGDIKWQIRKKDQINIESKLKTVRYIGELVKFKMFLKSESLHILKMLLLDFKHHNIEMACSFLEVCGRFLYRSPDSHHRTKIYLDIMMRKKSALHLDSRYSAMIENAFYYSNPPDMPSFTRKVRPVMHEYICKLLYRDLSKNTIEKVLRQMRKLNWDDPEISAYATKRLMTIWMMKYNNIQCAANLLAGLAPYHDRIAIQVVDGILEDIRVGMEINHPKFNQRRVSAVKFLGELYNYRMVESSVIFKKLYSFITFGVLLDERNPSPLDAPDHLFRIRLVCILLETCGQYFDRGSSKKKLDFFLLYFQRYYWFKKSSTVFMDDRPFPIDIKNLVQDTLDEIRPKFKFSENYQQACDKVAELEKAFREKLAAILPIKDTDDDTAENEPVNKGLDTIQEASEELSQGLSQLQMTDEAPSTMESDEEHDSRPERRSDSQSQNIEGSDIESESESDVIDSAGEDENDDNVHVLTGGPRQIECPEDNDFLSAFDKMMTDTIQARAQESVKVPTLDIAVPMHLRGSNKMKPQVGTVSLPSICASMSASDDLSPALDETEEISADSIKFVLMVRKGNKQHFADLNVPVSAEFAAKFKEREEAERVEKERMKRVVLDMHERQEEEDYQEMLTYFDKPVQPVAFNRERQVKFKHQKGVPDTDKIFGSGPKGKH